MAREFSCTTQDMLLSIAFTAQPGKEGTLAFFFLKCIGVRSSNAFSIAFDLGVLSGKFKDLLGLQQEIQFKAINSTVARYSSVLMCALIPYQMT